MSWMHRRQWNFLHFSTGLLHEIPNPMPNSCYNVVAIYQHFFVYCPISRSRSHLTEKEKWRTCIGLPIRCSNSLVPSFHALVRIPRWPEIEYEIQITQRFHKIPRVSPIKVIISNPFSLLVYPSLHSRACAYIHTLDFRCDINHFFSVQTLCAQCNVCTSCF